MNATSVRALRFRLPPKPIRIVIAVACVAGLFAPNPALTISAALLVGWFFNTLWRPGEPPILLLAMGYQWLQVTTKTFHADALGLDVNELAIGGGDVALATWLSMASLAMLALGMRWGTAGGKGFEPDLCRDQTDRFSLSKLWWIYLAFLCIAIVIHQLAFVYPGLTQPVIALVGLKWALFFVFAYTSIIRRKYGLLTAAFAIEFAVGLSGFFAGFKTVFLVLVLALLTARSRFRMKELLAIGAVITLLLAIALIWTAIKVDYRSYISNDSSTQVVSRSYPDRMDKLIDLAADVGAEDLDWALDALLRRLSYVDYFGRVVTTVPHYIPFERGELWLGAIYHVATPRLLFPDKPTLRSDSEITRTYTGLHVAGTESGASISIGYVAETYIDFGPTWMFPPILLLGFLWGRIYRYLTSRRTTAMIFGHGLAVAVLLPVMLFETTNVKLLGGVITLFIVAVAVQKIIGGNFARIFSRRTKGLT